VRDFWRMSRSLGDCQLLISSAALITRGWLALEFGESLIVSKDRGHRTEKFGKCIG